MSVTWLDGVVITVEAALSAATGSYGAWDSAVWDTSTWGPDAVYVDITAYLRGFDTDRHFSREVAAWEAGTASIVLDNRDGRFSADNLSGPYVTGGVTQIRPWRPIRIRAAYGGTTYYVYTGYATAWEESYSLDGANRGDAIVTVQCVDELGSLARFNPLATSVVGTGELPGLRVHRLLNNAGSIAPRSIDPGTFTLQGTTMAANVVTDLKLTADSEAGAIYILKDGTVRFDDQLAIVTQTRSSVSQATFGDGGGAELPYEDIEIHYDGDLLTNVASFARVGGTAVQAQDNTSRALYQDKTFQRSDLICQTDTQVQSLANWYVAQFASPERRVTRIDINPRETVANWSQVLGREVRDLVTVKRRPPGGFTISRDCHIAGIRHSARPAEWKTSFALFSATPYQTAGRWDYAIWDGSTWFI